VPLPSKLTIRSVKGYDEKTKIPSSKIEVLSPSHAPDAISGASGHHPTLAPMSTPVLTPNVLWPPRQPQAPWLPHQLSTAFASTHPAGTTGTNVV